MPVISPHQWHRLIRPIKALEKSMTNLLETLELVTDKANLESELDARDCARIRAFNLHLQKLKLQLRARMAEIRQDITPRLHNPEDPLADIEIEARAFYLLREDDPAWREDSDNILTERCYTEFGLSNDEDWRTGNAYEPIPISEKHDWLLHDLNDHDYGLECCRLSWKNIARIGEIWVDVCIREQFFIRIDTGEHLQSNV